MIRPLLAAALCLTCSACNLAIDSEDREPFPVDCGNLDLDRAELSFADPAANRCYSMLTDQGEIDPDTGEFIGVNHDFARINCLGHDGYLACINSVEEFHLIASSVPTDAWVGMFNEDGVVICDDQRPVNTGLNIWQNGSANFENNGTCSEVSSAAINTLGCGNTNFSWICEFEITPIE